MPGNIPENDAIPVRDEWEITVCFGCRKRRKVSFPPYCHLCWYNHAGERSPVIRWAVRRHFSGDMVRTCGHRHMSYISAAECAFTLMGKNARNDIKAVDHWLNRIMLAPERRA